MGEVFSNQASSLTLPHPALEIIRFGDYSTFLPVEALVGFGWMVTVLYTGIWAITETPQ